MYTRFQTKTAQKPNPMGRHIPICLSPPPPPSRARIKSLIETNFASGVKPTNIGSPECIIIVIKKSFQRFRALGQTHVRVRDYIIREI